MKWEEGRALQKLNWKLPANKNGNNILRIYSETLQKLHMNHFIWKPSESYIWTNHENYK